MPSRRPPDPELDKKTVVKFPTAAKPLTPAMRKLISSEKAEELRAKAELEHVAKLTSEAEDAYLGEMRQKVLEEKDPDAVEREIYIDLPPEAPYLLTNGVICYFPNTKYKVTKEVYDDLQSRMWCAWVNEVNRLDDKTANQYRRTINKTMSGRGMHE